MKDCPHCKTINDDAAEECVDCCAPLPPGPYSVENGEPADDEPSEPSQAILALVLAILAWLSCGILFSIPALFVARKELDQIAWGRREARNLNTANAAYWIAVINIGVSVLAVFVGFASYALSAL